MKVNLIKKENNTSRRPPSLLERFFSSVGFLFFATSVFLPFVQTLLAENVFEFLSSNQMGIAGLGIAFMLFANAIRAKRNDDTNGPAAHIAAIFLFVLGIMIIAGSSIGFITSVIALMQ